MFVTCSVTFEARAPSTPASPSVSGGVAATHKTPAAAGSAASRLGGRANALSAFRSAASAMRTGVVLARANTRRVTARLAGGFGDLANVFVVVVVVAV